MEKTGRGRTADETGRAQRSVVSSFVTAYYFYIKAFCDVNYLFSLYMLFLMEINNLPHSFRNQDLIGYAMANR